MSIINPTWAEVEGAGGGFEPDLQACEGGWRTPDSEGLQNPSSKPLIGITLGHIFFSQFFFRPSENSVKTFFLQNIMRAIYVLCTYNEYPV